MNSTPASSARKLFSFGKAGKMNKDKVKLDSNKINSCLTYTADTRWLYAVKFCSVGFVITCQKDTAAKWPNKTV